MQVGIDIQDTEPIKRFIGTNKMERVFSASELEYIRKKAESSETVAGMFCAKEAFFKAIGKGINISQLRDVEVKHSTLGAPYYHLSDKLIADNGLKTANLMLSISHTKNTAVAVCIIIRKDLLMV